MGKVEVSAFLTDLAVRGNVAASTQNQALAAILFLYRAVFEKDFGWLDDVVRAKKPKRVPVVLTRDEVSQAIANLSGTTWMVAMLQYGAGLRLMESLRLRVKDLDFQRCQITVRDGKGPKDRFTVLPKVLVLPLTEHLVHVKQAHERAMREGYGGVELPTALVRKYPQAPYQWGWQYVFPSDKPSVDPRSGARRRHHLHESSIQKAVAAAMRKAGIRKHAGCH